MAKKREWYTISAKDEAAEILIYDVIGEDWMGGISAKQFVNDLNALDVKNINVRINSPGGDVFEGTAIYNALIGHKARITTQIDGMALSMASVVAMAGDTIVMADNAMMMIHNPWTFAMGDAGELRKTADVLDKTKLNLLAAYDKQSPLENDEISALMDEETWMTGPEALEKGFVDEVTEPVKMAAHFDKKVYAGFKHTPESILEPEIEEPQGHKVAIERMRLNLIV